MHSKSILASVATGGCLFGVFALLALTIDQPSKKASVLLSTSKNNQLAAVSSLHSAKREADDLASYFDSIPTSNVNAFHEPRTQLISTASSGAQAGAHLSTKAAQKDLSSYFRAVPTTAVNAFHDPSKPPHYYTSPSHAHQKLSDKKAEDELDDYFNNLPAHNVNAYHDGSAGHFDTSHGISTAKADSEISNYYDSVPAHLVNANHEPNKGQESQHLSLRQSAKPSQAPQASAKAPTEKAVAAKAVTGKAVTGKKVAPVIAHAAGTKLVKTAGRHEPFGDTKISVIQEWGPDADAPTAKELARQKGGAYDTQYGMQDGLAIKKMEDTPAGPVQTSFGVAPKKAPAGKKKPIAARKAADKK